MEKKLEVKNLRISFRTQGGLVRAVRGISFDLYKGETLAIVGESGSGKSVTSKAILGILANNSIVDEGQILYDGMDLLKISEEDFHRIRGDRIAMIFQDPLSSLNPIIRIGKQLTEAMLLKNKANKRRNRKLFYGTLKLIEKNLLEYYVSKGEDKKTYVDELVKTFKEFVLHGIILENAYTRARDALIEADDAVSNLLLNIDKKQEIDVKALIRVVLSFTSKVYNDFVIPQGSTELASWEEKLQAEKANCVKQNASEGAVEALRAISDILKSRIKHEVPNFFGLGFYMLRNPEFDAKSMTVDALNKLTTAYLNENFLNDFIEQVDLAVVHSHADSVKCKGEAINIIKESIATFSADVLDKKACKIAQKNAIEAVKVAIDDLDVHKDTMAYIFASNIADASRIYWEGTVKNPKELAKYNKRKAKHDALTAKGKVPDWKVVPPMITDLELAKSNILALMNNLVDKFAQDIEQSAAHDHKEQTAYTIEFLKERASGVLYTVTPHMARLIAIKLMEEVGIPQARRRYRQYPFEFSGGMRQRIVIAIALAANPDILICDEPTTALDVTIQSQILELINSLKVERNLSIIFITHDLGVVANMADRIAVMYAGKIVEFGTAEEIFYDPRHPYTWALLGSMPDLDTDEKLEAIPGTPPNMIFPPKGDAFAVRNKYALMVDFEYEPPMFKVTDTHYAATWLLHEDAPKVDPPKIVTDRINRMKIKGGMQ